MIGILIMTLATGIILGMIVMGLLVMRFQKKELRATKDNWLKTKTPATNRGL